MKTPNNYTTDYEAMPPAVRRRILSCLKQWGGWSRKTAYLKISGESLSPIEEVLVDGVFRVFNKRMSRQTEIEFVWYDEQLKPEVKDVTKDEDE